MVLEDRQLEPQRWVDRHADALYRYAMLHLGDPETAEERVQETFLAALQARASFRGASSERTWLIGILRHKICDLLRRRTRDETLPAGDEAAAFFTRSGKWRDAPRAWGSRPQELLDRDDFRGVLERCLGRLAEPLRDALCLREMHGLEHEQIRDILGLSATNLSTRLSRARLLLRRCLEAKWFTGP